MTQGYRFSQRFMGKSSALPLLFAGIGFKYYPNVAQFGADLISYQNTHNRTSFWRIPLWETTPFSPTASASSQANPFSAWPAPDLAVQLINLYFNHSNDLLPLLHKPSFFKAYNDQRFNADPGFARVCLLVFAVGAGYSRDPRVLVPKESTGRSAGGTGASGDQGSAGWIYYHAFGRIVRHRLAPTELYDLQISVVSRSVICCVTGNGFTVIVVSAASRSVS